MRVAQRRLIEVRCAPQRGQPGREPRIEVLAEQLRTIVAMFDLERCQEAREELGEKDRASSLRSERSACPLERVERRDGHAREHEPSRRIGRDRLGPRPNRREVAEEIDRRPDRRDQSGRDRGPHRRLQLAEVIELEHRVEPIDDRPPEREGAIDRRRVHRGDHPAEPGRQPIDEPLVDELQPTVLLRCRRARQLVDEQQLVFVGAPGSGNDLSLAGIGRRRAHEAAHVIEARKRSVQDARATRRDLFSERPHKRHLGLSREPDEEQSPFGREPRQDEHGQGIGEVDAEGLQCALSHVGHALHLNDRGPKVESDSPPITSLDWRRGPSPNPLDCHSGFSRNTCSASARTAARSGNETALAAPPRLTT